MAGLRCLPPRNSGADLRREVPDGSAAVLSSYRRLEPAECRQEAQRESAGDTQGDDGAGSGGDQTKTNAVGDKRSNYPENNGWGLGQEVLSPGGLQEVQTHPRADEVVDPDGGNH